MSQFNNAIDDLFETLEKARVTKYIKRIPHPSGKGYIYFYNRAQWDHYKKTGEAPKQKEGEHEIARKGIMAAYEALADFFGFLGTSDEPKFRAKIQEEHTKHKTKLEGLDVSEFARYSNEYLTNKDKWDKKLSAEKKEAGPKHEGTKHETKGEPGEKKEAHAGGFKLSVMRTIAGIYGGSKEGSKEGSKKEAVETAKEGFKKEAEKKSALSTAAEKLEAKVDKKRPPVKLTDFIGKEQFSTMKSGAKGEEKEHFQEKLAEMSKIFETMPRTYETDGQGDKAIAHLHYFTGGSDWYITELDKEPEQLQAFGYAVLNGDKESAELGYISIEELLQNKAELDLYYKPKTLGEIKSGKEPEKKESKDNFETMPESESKGKSIQAGTLFNINNKIIDKIGVSSGGEIRSDEKKAKQYADALFKELDKQGIKELPQKLYDKLEDQNYHLLNTVLGLGGYFGKDRQKDDFEFAKKMEKEDKVYNSFPLSAIGNKLPNDAKTPLATAADKLEEKVKPGGKTDKSLPKIGSEITIGSKNKKSVWTGAMKGGKKAVVIGHDKLDGEPVLIIALKEKYDSPDFDPHRDYEIIYLDEVKKGSIKETGADIKSGEAEADKSKKKEPAVKKEEKLSHNESANLHSKIDAVLIDEGIRTLGGEQKDKKIQVNSTQSGYPELHFKNSDAGIDEKIIVKSQADARAAIKAYREKAAKTQAKKVSLSETPGKKEKSVNPQERYNQAKKDLEEKVKLSPMAQRVRDLEAKGSEREITMYGRKEKIKTKPVILDVGFDYSFEIGKTSSKHYPWMILESKTGLAVSTQNKTQKEAIEDAIKKIKSRPESEFKKLVDDNMPEKIAKEKSESEAKEKSDKETIAQKEKEKVDKKNKIIADAESKRKGNSQEQYEQAKIDIKRFEDEEVRSDYSETEWEDYLKQMENDFKEDLKTYEKNEKYYKDAVDGLNNLKIYRNAKNNLSKLKDKAIDAAGQGKMFKATQLLLSELAKAKALPVGTVSGKYKKAAEGKWVRIKDEKKGGKEKPEKKEGKDEEKKGDVKEKNKGIIREALKKVATILADAISMKDAVGEAAQATEETGKKLEEKGKGMQEKKEKTTIPQGEESLKKKPLVKNYKGADQ